MGQKRHSRREFIGYAGLAGGGAVLLGACKSGGTSGGKGAAVLPPIEGGTVITDPARMPAKFSESPDFAKLVAAGKLPPVTERLGSDPLVIKPLNEIGRYGGALRRGFVGPGDHQNGRKFCTGPDRLLYWDYESRTVVPNLARGFDMSADGKVMTLHLRRGMKWSDGKPFTADDIVFWREDINLEEDLAGESPTLNTEGGPVRVTKIDDYTVRYVAPVPHPYLPELLAGSTTAGLSSNEPTADAGFAPKHYLSRFLPKYSSAAEANKKASAAGFKSWPLYVEFLMDWARNPALPVLTPWVVTSPITKPPWRLEANPYSIWVDSEGNQLPYIPTITMQDTGNPELLTAQAVAGAYDFQDRGLNVPSLPVLLRNQKRGNYTIRRAPNDDINLLLRLNLAYDKDKVIGDLLRNVDFRRALSLGIDREEVNKTFFLGAGKPSASMVSDDNRYFPGPKWRTMWATHDVAQANRLLDGIGLRERDGDGFRLRSDDKKRIRLDFSATKTYLDFPAMAEMIRSQWRKIGIDASVRTVDSGAIVQQIYSNDLMIMPLGGFAPDVFIDRINVLPSDTVAGVMGIPYAQWFDSKGRKGVRPPSSLRLLEETMNLYSRGLKATSDAERIKMGKQIYMAHADQVWSIGVIGFGYGLYGMYLAKNSLGNVPRRILNDLFIDAPTNTLPMTFYYKQAGK